MHFLVGKEQREINNHSNNSYTNLEVDFLSKQLVFAQRALGV